MRFEISLVRAGVISSETFVSAVDRQLARRPLIGELAIRSRRLSMKQLFRICSLQATSNECFGRIAVKLGLLTKTEIAELLAEQLAQTQPLSEVLLEMNALDAETLTQAQQAFRAEIRDGELPETTDATGEFVGDLSAKKTTRKSRTRQAAPSAKRRPAKKSAKKSATRGKVGVQRSPKKSLVRGICG